MRAWQGYQFNIFLYTNLNLHLTISCCFRTDGIVLQQNMLYLSFNCFYNVRFFVMCFSCVYLCIVPRATVSLTVRLFRACLFSCSSTDFVLLSFLPRCMECRRRPAMRMPSHLSVCLSNACIVTKRVEDLSRFLYQWQRHILKSFSFFSYTEHLQKLRTEHDIVSLYQLDLHRNRPDCTESDIFRKSVYWNRIVECVLYRSNYT